MDAWFGKPNVLFLFPFGTYKYLNAVLLLFAGWIQVGYGIGLSALSYTD